MAFRWSLQRLLDVTAKRESAAKAQLFDLSRRIARGQEEIQRRRTMLRLLLRDLAQREIAERMEQQEVLMRCGRAEEKTIRRLQQNVENLTGRRETKKEELVKLMAKKDTLEKLRGQARKQYERLRDLREQQQMDEAFQIGFVRRTQQPGKLISA